MMLKKFAHHSSAFFSSTDDRIKELFQKRQIEEYLLTENNSIRKSNHQFITKSIIC
jgi:hypothetical protein